MDRKFLVGLTVLALAGCQTDQQTLDTKQSSAVDAALTRGRFEMDCPAATGSVLSRQVIQPIAFGGVERVEYTVGIEGCGKRMTSIVVCAADGTGCFAGEAPR